MLIRLPLSLRAEEHELNPLAPHPVEIAIMVGTLLVFLALVALVVVLVVRSRRRR
ncbi:MULTISPECIES: hypothetical protein [unclassified Nocardioides]|uniref:hypothetical protein n=1 Tax=unclassified Nocardioides TaxID=2615069 RepID=UPI00266676C0|nr:hypothetical protein [Nocardioides sp. Arc9.136]WKN49868.1 hypothetical protein OSR43_07000 [Nocardioides sp. Arc9.136]